MSTVFRASNDISDYRASQARLSDGGWCSGELATDIFDPYIEIDFGRDLLFTSLVTQGVDFVFSDSFITRFRIEVAGENGYLQYIAPLLNISQPAVSNCPCDLYVKYVYMHTDIPTGTE